MPGICEMYLGVHEAQTTFIIILKQQEEGSLPNSLYDASIILTLSWPGEDITEKLYSNIPQEPAFTNSKQNLANTI